MSIKKSDNDYDYQVRLWVKIMTAIIFIGATIMGAMR